MFFILSINVVYEQWPYPRAYSFMPNFLFYFHHCVSILEAILIFFNGISLLNGKNISIAKIILPQPFDVTSPQKIEIEL